tara:strand:+ start:1810 stop:2073 length:264 start_codon:yes stop_codon:yes gene_type:complete
MSNEDFNDLQEIILDDLSKNSSLIIYVNHEGNVFMISTGKSSKKQQKMSEKILTVISDHSFVFKIVLFAEIMFSRLLFKFGSLFNKR